MSTSDSSKMSMQDRLRALEMKKNEARGRLQRAVKEEEANSKPVKKEHEDDAERHKQFQEKLKEEGIDPERYARLHQTQEAQEEKEGKNKRKHANAGVDPFTTEGQYRTFKRRRGEMDFDAEAYERQKADMGDDFYDPVNSVSYGQEVKDAPERVMLLVTDQKKYAQKNANFSRPRVQNDTKDVTFINERNRKFNEKIGRAYDKYTEDIKESLERGTAL